MIKVTLLLVGLLFAASISAKDCQCNGVDLDYPQYRSKLDAVCPYMSVCCSQEREEAISEWRTIGKSTGFSERCVEQLTSLSCAVTCYPDNSYFTDDTENGFVYSISSSTAARIFTECRDSLAEKVSTPQEFLSFAFGLFAKTTNQPTLRFTITEEAKTQSLKLESLKPTIDCPESHISHRSMKRQTTPDVVTNNTACVCDDSPPHGNLTLAINRTLNTSFCPQWSGVCCSYASESDLIAQSDKLASYQFVPVCRNAILQVLCLSICYPNTAAFVNWSYNATGQYYKYVNKITDTAAQYLYDQCKTTQFAVGTLKITVGSFFKSPTELLNILGGRSQFYTPGPGLPEVVWNITLDDSPAIDYSLLPPEGPTCFEPLPRTPTPTPTQTPTPTPAVTTPTPSDLTTTGVSSTTGSATKAVSVNLLMFVLPIVLLSLLQIPAFSQ